MLMSSRQTAWAQLWIGKEVNVHGEKHKVVKVDVGERGNGIWLITDGSSSKYVRFPKDLANPRR